MIRLGLIGTGRWGRHYVEAAKLAGNCEVVAEASLSHSRGGPDVDAVVIATPPNVMVDRAVAVLRARLPVMVEKPVGLSVREAKSLESLGGLCLVNHQHLFAPAYEELYRRAKDIPYLQISTRGGDSKPAHDWSWLWDWAPHDIAMVLDLGGFNPQLASVWRDDASTLARWRTARGSAFAHVGVNFDRKHRYLKVNDHGFSMVYDDRAEHKLVIDGVPVEVSPELPLTRSLRAFASAVAEGGTTDRRFGARWGVAVAEQIEAIESFGSLRAVV